SKCGSSPAIISVALRSSLASCPCVTTTTPTVGSVMNGYLLLRDVAMAHTEAQAWRRDEPTLEFFGDGHRPMLAAGAANRHGDVALALFRILGQQELEQIVHAGDELVHVGELVENRPYGRILAGTGAEVRLEMRVRQEPCVEHEIGVQRHTVLEPETEQRDDGSWPRLAFARRRHEGVPQFVHGHVG